MITNPEPMDSLISPLPDEESGILAKPIQKAYLYLRINKKIMKNTGKIFVAALGGAIAGGAAGVLLAPDKGEETRKKISKQAKKAREELNDLVKKGKDTAEDVKKKTFGS